jgi:colicin import membrane protein
VKLDHTYILPSIFALIVHVVVAFIVMSEWQSSSQRIPPVQVKQRVEATLIDLDSLLAQQKLVDSAAIKKAAAKKAAAKKAAAKKAADKKAADKKAADKKAADKKAAQQLEEVQQALDSLLDDEEAQSQALEQQVSNGQAVSSAVHYIRDEISLKWVRPANALTGMIVELEIHLVPTGEVVDIQISYRDISATDAFVLSVVKAVKKVGRFDKLSQLDSVLFDANFRKFTLKFKPEDLRL